jgi:hypothetical protein
MLKVSDDTYTKKIDTPLYEPKGDKPELDHLYDDHRAQGLLDNIEKSELPADIKKFLSLAAYRHIEFDYGRIAEYYAHADKDTQKLFEDSALVIIDFDRAIELGYTKLRDDIADIYLESADNNA